MDDKMLKWLSAIMISVIGVGYIIWLCLAFIKVSETEKHIQAQVDKLFTRVPTSDTVPDSGSAESEP